MIHEDKAPLSELQHYGVKGMKWGVRRNRDSDGSNSPRKISRKENRQMNREAKSAFYEKKADTLLKEAVKGGDDILIRSLMQGDSAPMVRTGSEFARDLKNGRAMNVKMSDIYAKVESDGNFHVNDKYTIGNYKKTNYRKQKG